MHDAVNDSWKEWIYVMRADGSSGRARRLVDGFVQDWARMP